MRFPGQRFVSLLLSSLTLWSCRCMWLCKLLIAAPKCTEPPCKVLLFLVVATAVLNTVTVAWSQLRLPRRPISFLLWEGVSEPCSRLKNHLTSGEQEVWFQRN